MKINIGVSFDNKLYKSDYVSVKKYNNEMYKLTYFKTPVRQNGFDIKQERVTGVNTQKLDNNISRAKSRVFEYALCNEFEYFVTLTINKNKYDRNDLKTYYNDFRVFLKNYSRNHKTKVEYVFIPEKHKDGAWHMHGLIKGIPKKHLMLNEHGYLDWFHYRDRFGYISLDPIRSQEDISKYITKYINKELSRTIEGLNQHMYYASKGLNTAVEIKKGTLWSDSIPYDFENDYVKIKWLKNDEIISSIEE
jgi:hypothetical protein